MQIIIIIDLSYWPLGHLAYIFDFIFASRLSFSCLQFQSHSMPRIWFIFYICEFFFIRIMMRRLQAFFPWVNFSVFLKNLCSHTYSKHIFEMFRWRMKWMVLCLLFSDDLHCAINQISFSPCLKPNNFF